MSAIWTLGLNVLKGFKFRLAFFTCLQNTPAVTEVPQGSGLNLDVKSMLHC